MSFYAPPVASTVGVCIAAFCAGLSGGAIDSHADVVIPTGIVTFHRGDSDAPGNGSNVRVIDGSGMSKTDPNDPSTWTVASTAWQDDWQGFDVPTGGVNKTWVVLDLGAPTAHLAKMYLWNVEESNALNRGVNAFEVYHATAPTVAPPATGSSSTPYDFASGGWTQLPGSFNLAPGSQIGDNGQNFDVSGAAGARYIGLRVTSNHGGIRTGLAEAAFTTAPPVPMPPVINSFVATPDAYVAPGSSTLTWDVSGADSLSINGTVVTGQPNFMVVPGVTTTYTLTATNVDGPSTAQVTVTVDPPAIIDSFTADQSIINTGESVTLSWATRFATGWSISPAPGDVSMQTTGGAGDVAVTPTAPTTYTMTAMGPMGNTTAEVTVDVVVPADHLVISEFVADNETGLTDGDGDFSDWIEIYNPTASEIDLAGFYLTDDAADLAQWVFPSRLIPAGGRVVVFASNKHPTGPAGELHTNFRLSRGGEYLALVAPNGTTVLHEFEPAFPAQSDDVSYGILHGDLAREQFMGIPTPGAANDPTPAAPKAVLFTLPSQTFTGTLNVGLSTETAGASIYYTTDGSEPTAAGGTPYTSSIPVSSTTHLRAVAELAGQTGQVSGEAYVRLGPDVAGYESDLPLLVIDNFGGGTIPAKSWSGTGSGVQQFARQSAVWATFDRDPADGMAALADAPEMISRTGIRGRGAFSSTWTQKPYSVETWDEAGTERDVAVLGMPAHADWLLYYPDTDSNKDPSMMFNTFIYELSNNMGRYATRFRWVEVFINENGGDLSLGDRRGVYAIMEKVSRGEGRLDFERLSEDGATGGWLLGLNRMDSIPVGGFPAENGATRPQFFHTKGPNRISQTAPNSSGGGDDIPRQSNGYLNFDNPGGYRINAAQRAAIEGWFSDFEDVLYDNGLWLDPDDGYRKYLDPVDFVEYFMFNNLSRNGDGMLISMFPWKGDDGKLRMGPAWDYNWSSYYINGGPTGTLWHRANRLWYDRLFDDPDFEQLYIDRWFFHRDRVMSNTAIAAIVDGQATEIGTGRALRQGFANVAAWTSEVAKFKNWLTDRADWYDSQFIARPVFDTPGGDVPSGFGVTFAAPAGTIYYTTDGSDPRVSGGGVASAAQQYTAAVPLSESTLITARTRSGSAWSAPAEAYFFIDTVAANSSNLVVSEFHYRPADASSAEVVAGFTDRDRFEFVELMNTGSETLNLTGVRFIRVAGEGIEFDFSTSKLRTLGVGERILLVKDLAAFEQRYGTGLTGQIAGEYSGNLGNDGELLTLVDAADTTIHAFTYNDQPPWPESADGDGPSLVLIASTQMPPPDHNDPFNWRPSVADGGTPGGSDAVDFSGDPDADGDGDRLSAFMEHALGTSDGDPSLGGTPVVGVGLFNDGTGTFVNYPTITFQRNLAADDVVYEVQTSTTLESLSWVAGAAAAEYVAMVDQGDGTALVTWRSTTPAAGLEREFIRLVVRSR